MNSMLHQHIGVLFGIDDVEQLDDVCLVQLFEDVNFCYVAIFILSTIFKDNSNLHLCVEVIGQLYLSSGLLSRSPEYDIMIFVREKSLCRLRPEMGIFVV